MKVKTIAFFAAALLGGVAIGWAVRPVPPPQVEVKEKTRPRAQNRVADVGADAVREALRRRVKDLEREIAALRSNHAAREFLPATNTEARVEPPRRFDMPGPAAFRAHMEEMRQNDPKRYAQMTNGMARFRAFGLRNAANKLDTLASVDTSRLSKSEIATHERLQVLIAREQELHDIARPDNGDVTDEERAAAWKELHELGREKHSLEQRERDTLLAKTAEAYGVSGQAAAELVETVKAVYQATESHFGGPRGGPRHRHGGNRR